MTEKRFTTDNGSNEDVCLIDNITGKEYESNFDDIVDLLNEQNEIIQQQKEVIEHLSYDCEYIQNTIKEAYNNERTQIGKNTLKQLLEAIQ